MNEYITIFNFERLSKQELFDMSAKHLLQTRRRSTSNNTDACVYSGSGCGAAPFIRATMHSTADYYGSWHGLCSVRKAPTHECDFVQQLQDAHDGADDGDSFITTWKPRMIKLAQKFDLSTAVLDADKD